MNSKSVSMSIRSGRTETDREINGKGELKKETVKVFEVFPIAASRAGDEVDQ